jgi:hypothetical protein
MSPPARKAFLAIKTSALWIIGETRGAKSARKGIGKAPWRIYGDVCAQLIAHKMPRKFAADFKALEPFIALNAFRANEEGGSL